MAGKKHTHKYYKQGTGTWACALLDCSHFLPLNVAESISHRSSICWGCNTKFDLDEKLIKQDKPKCYECVEFELFGASKKDNLPDLSDFDRALKLMEQKKKIS